MSAERIHATPQNRQRLLARAALLPAGRTQQRVDFANHQCESGMENVAGRKGVDGNHVWRPRPSLMSGIEPQEAIGTKRHADHSTGNLLHPAQPFTDCGSAAGET
jgi:hypothetical protein